MRRNDRGHIERSLTRPFERARLFPTRQLPREIEILFRLLNRSAPEIDESRPHVEARQQHSLIETLRQADCPLCRLERAVPIADPRQVLNGQFGGPEGKKWRAHLLREL